MTTETASISIQILSAAELEERVSAFVGLLCDVVNGGAAMGFLAPLASAEATEYWLSLRSELNAGSRLLLGAFVDGRLAGSGQLALSRWPNASHRAELQKLIVATRMRGRGVGRALMLALHDAARLHGRSLIILYTRRETGAQGLYEDLGYTAIGVIPGYTFGTNGERYDTVVMYTHL